MAYVDFSTLNRQLPHRKFKLFFVGVGLAFWLAWGAAGVFLIDGHPVNGIEACGPMDQTGIFWECTSGKLHALVASAANTVIMLTLAMPAFVMVASFDPAAMPLAIPGLMFHLLGLPAGLFVLARSIRRLIEHIRR
ncbi:MAG: hypothetical protein AB8B88_06330 [Devosiaceae bacterium]